MPESPSLIPPESPANPTHVAILPIRTLAIRTSPRYNSSTNIKRSGDDQGSSENSYQNQHRVLSPAISKTIDELEHLLQEAVDIAATVWDDNEGRASTNGKNSRRTSAATRRPSEGISSRVANYLGKSSSRKIPTIAIVKPNAKEQTTFIQAKRAGSDDDVFTDVELEGAESGAEPVSAQSRTDLGSNTRYERLSIPAAGEPKLVSRSASTKVTFAKDPEWLSPVPISEQHDPVPCRRITSRMQGPPNTTTQHSSVNSLLPPPNLRRASTQIRDFANHRTSSLETPTLSGYRSRAHISDKEEAIHDSSCVEGDGIVPEPRLGHERHFTNMFGTNSGQGSVDYARPVRTHTEMIDLRGCRHVDVQNRPDDYNVHDSCHHAPVARNWPRSRKRFTASIACINAACIGLLIGIYAGEVPAIQYVIVDFHHYTILGNVFLYLGLAFSTLVFWPLPLLHGRKPYTVISLATALCLQIPQGVAVSAFRSPYVRTYRIVLLLSRAISGFALGFANLNILATLLDLFGASLQSRNTHPGLVDEFDVRQHGGGMGLWLGFWSWCTIAPIAVGFLAGACVIESYSVTWGFWISLLLLMLMILLNVIAPEVRRSAFRRTIADITGEGGEFSRVARGEIKLHLRGTGPYWWGEEVMAGLRMCWLMIKQPGFLVMAFYGAWVYAQFTMVLMLFGALVSTYYRYKPFEVGLCGFCLGLGSTLALPFQKASIFSQFRYRPPRTDSMSFQKFFIWKSHLVRRTTCMVFLPVAAIGYMFASWGPPLTIIVPCITVIFIGFFSNLIIAECYGLVMETFDTSDLQVGMVGRPRRKSVVEYFKGQRTNFSCYPRISAGFAVIEALKFVLGAAVTGVCGRVARRLGAMKATAIVAAILVGLTLLLMIILFRWKSVQMIPEPHERLTQLKRKDTIWEPTILGRPSGTNRKISIFEAGKQTRWSEIRRRNRLNTGLTGW